MKRQVRRWPGILEVKERCREDKKRKKGKGNTESKKKRKKGIRNRKKKMLGKNGKKIRSCVMVCKGEETVGERI